MVGEEVVANNQQLSYEVAVYSQQLKLLHKEIERINITMLDLANAEKTVEHLKNDDVLVPIGGGIFVKANIYTTRILVPVGANYIVEMEKEQAATEVKKRVDATQKAVAKLQEEFTKIEKRLQDAGSKLRRMQTDQAISQMAEANIGEDYI